MDSEARDLADVPAAEVIAAVAVHLMSAAAVKCGLSSPEETDLDEARKLITALAGLVESRVTSDLGANVRPNLQMQLQNAALGEPFGGRFDGVLLSALIGNNNSGVYIAGDTIWCDVAHHVPHSADCPHNQKPRGPESNIFAEVTHHWALAEVLTVPVTGVLYRSEFYVRTPAHPISRPQTPPFQPPKQA